MKPSTFITVHERGILFSLPVCVSSESRYRHSRIRELFVPLLSVFSINPSSMSCPGCSVTEERETTWWPLRLLVVSRRFPIRWLSWNGRLFVRPEDGWLSNNRTDTSLLVTKLDAFVFPREAHTECMSVCKLTWSTLHDNGPGLTVAMPRTVCTVASFNTYTGACFSSKT